MRQVITKDNQDFNISQLLEYFFKFSYFYFAKYNISNCIKVLKIKYYTFILSIHKTKYILINLSKL